MKFNVALIGSLPSDITSGTISFSAPWLTASHTLLLIGNEIIEVSVVGVTATFRQRGIYNSTPSFHQLGTNVFSLSVARPLVFEHDILLSGIYPVISKEDVSVSSVSLSGFEFFEKVYSRFSLVSLLYPVVNEMIDNSSSNITALVTVAQYPSLKDDFVNTSMTLTNIVKTSITRYEANNTETFAIGQSIIGVTKQLTVINTAYTDTSGFDIQIVTGTLEEILINTEYSDNAGFDIQIVAGTLV